MAGSPVRVGSCKCAPTLTLIRFVEDAFIYRRIFCLYCLSAYVRKLRKFKIRRCEYIINYMWKFRTHTLVSIYLGSES